MLQVYQRVWISLVEVYKRVVKFVFPSVNGPKRLREEFMAVKLSQEKFPGFVLFCFSYLKNATFIALKRDGAFKSTYVQFVSFVNRRYSKGVPFLAKMADKRVRGRSSGRSLPE